MTMVDISHTVKPAELMGGRLWRNLDTGETTLVLPDVVADPDEVDKVLEGEISPEHHALLDSAEQEYLEQKAAAEELLPEVPATTAQARSKGKK